MKSKSLRANEAAQLWADLHAILTELLEVDIKGRE